MSLVDPLCYPLPADDRPVCAACFADVDLKRRVRANNGPRGCAFCGHRDAPTAPIGEIALFVGERMATFYGKAVDQLPYESAEGGYQGWHVDTEDLLFDTIGLKLPRDEGSLAQAIIDEIGDDAWCEHDWLSLEYDDELRSDWDQFCLLLMHERRFFLKLWEAMETAVARW